MKNDVGQTLERVALETIERHAFMFGDPVEAATTPFDLQAGLEFDGAARGRLTVRCSRGFAEEMAANLIDFGDCEVDESLVKDVLLEFVNVLAGCMLAEVSPGSRAVRLTPPHLDPEVALPTDGPDVHRGTLAADEHAFEFELEFMTEEAAT